ncbi:peptidase U32 family protein [Desulfovibrio psychrotolerans]|uniref:Peptidase U32 n=1 Tax=Desulfovibrio psychrotolerans TaxID=415242 RepID=A0A7J0BSU5_9BACT|nr:peptidase U32 family protein [Desulfovibrio psychrotolerans]GFM36786.1 hypothetical protein DSM19430T_14700 [Desulfovibrio psychrotolerans]
MPHTPPPHSAPAHPQLPELLCPAGDMDRLDAALAYGADACYLGGTSLSLRAGTGGFNAAALSEACTKAHARNASIYFTLNILPHQTHLPDVAATLDMLAHSAVDGIIIADPGVLRMARRIAPHKPVHLSTQANTANSEAVGFWHDLGISRVNLARELNAPTMRQLVRAFPDMEFEVFVHGAMCLALSGRCLLSAWLNGRPANLGECTHPCRFEYRGVSAANSGYSGGSGGSGGCSSHGGHGNSGYSGAFPTGNTVENAQGILHSSCMATTGIPTATAIPPLAVEEKTRSGAAMWEITREEPYSAFWAPEDLCLVKYLPWFVRTGIASLKIEGRMKTPGYVAHVADTYRTALNDVAAGRFRPHLYLHELQNTASRNLGTGFFLPGGRRRSLPPLPAGERRPIVAQVRERLADDAWRIAVRSPWDDDRPVQLMLPGLRRPEISPGTYAFENHRGEACHRLNPGTEALLRCTDPAMSELEPGLFIR